MFKKFLTRERFLPNMSYPGYSSIFTFLSYSIFKFTGSTLHSYAVFVFASVFFFFFGRLTLFDTTLCFFFFFFIRTSNFGAEAERSYIF